jgi:hypothetical protein
LQSLYTTLCSLPPVRLTLTLTARVQGTFCCVLFLQVLCRMKKLLGGVKRAFLSGSSSRGCSSLSNDRRTQDLPQSPSFVPSLHRTVGSSRYLADDDVPEATNNDNISIRTTKEMEKYECHAPFQKRGNEASTRVPRMFKSDAWQQYDKQMQCYE